MKRHLMEARYLSLYAAIAVICVLGVPGKASAASKSEAKVPVNQGNTFLTNIVSGNAVGGWADRTNWQSIFRFGQPGLFGGVYITELPVFQKPAVSKAPRDTASPDSAKPAGLSFIKLGGGTLRVSTGTYTYYSSSASSVSILAGELSLVGISGSVLTIGQPSGAPEASSTAGSSEPLITGNAEITSTPQTQPSSQEADAAPSAPSRRPKPPTPPGPSVVSR